MSLMLKLKGGASVEHSTFVGADREVTVDTDKKTLVVHDGVTPGGTPLAKENMLSLFLPLTGGSMNGPITAIKETKVNMLNNTIDLSIGNFFTKTITTATTFNISNIALDGVVNSFVLELTNGGNFAVTLWPNIKWSSGTKPTLTLNGTDTLGFITYNGGLTWIGYSMGLDLK